VFIRVEVHMDRFDFDKLTRDALNAAVDIGIIDAVELGCMIATHGVDAEVIMTEITEAAYADIHCSEGYAAHAQWCRVNNQWRAEHPRRGAVR